MGHVMVLDGGDDRRDMSLVAWPRPDVDDALLVEPDNTHVILLPCQKDLFSFGSA